MQRSLLPAKTACVCSIRHASFFPLQHKSDPTVEALKPSEKPLSPSYYSGQPKFNDTLHTLELILKETRKSLRETDILTSYSASPAKQFAALGMPLQTMHSDWFSQQDMSGRLGVTLSISQYRQVLKLLNALKALSPHLQLADTLGLPYSTGDYKATLDKHLAPYRRPSEGSNRSSKDLSDRIDSSGRAYAVGRRKESSAQVWMIPVLNQETTAKADVAADPPIGQILINAKSLSEYFTSPTKRQEILRPFSLTNSLGKYNVFALARGGGQTGQAEALQLALAKALVVFEGDEVRRVLKKGALDAALLF
jgi:small subunit ribosomal protein S9